MTPRQRIIGRTVRLAALLLVAILAALLTFRIVQGNPGAGFMRAVEAHRAPAAPDGRLAVIWHEAHTWPQKLRNLGARDALRLEDLRGYPVVVNFFASWCSPCASEAAALAAAARAHSGRVVFLGVDVHDLTPDARRFLRGHGVPYIAVRATSSTLDRFGLIGLPETFYVDRRGRVQAVTRGQLSAETLARELARASQD